MAVTIDITKNRILEAYKGNFGAEDAAHTVLFDWHIKNVDPDAVRNSTDERFLYHLDERPRAQLREDVRCNELGMANGDDQNRFIQGYDGVRRFAVNELFRHMLKKENGETYAKNELFDHNMNADMVKQIAKRFSINGKPYSGSRLKGEITDSNWKYVLNDMSMYAAMSFVDLPNAPTVGLADADNQPIILFCDETTYAAERAEIVSRYPQKPGFFKRILNKLFGLYKETNAAYQERKEEIDTDLAALDGEYNRIQTRKAKANQHSGELAAHLRQEAARGAEGVQISSNELVAEEALEHGRETAAVHGAASLSQQVNMGHHTAPTNEKSGGLGKK